MSPRQTIPRSVGVVAPCLNEQTVLPMFLERVVAACEQTGLEFNVLVVDDGSTDSTWRILEAAAHADSRISGISLLRNFGHQAALTAGLLHVRGDAILIIDADLQDPPELIPQMLARMIETGADILYGQRISRKGVSWHLRVCYVLFYKVLDWMAGCDIPRDTGDFRLVSRKVVECINLLPEQPKFLRGLFSWTGFKQVPFHYNRDSRAAGTPAYTLPKLFDLAVTGIMSFSIKPLRLATAFAAVLALASLLITFCLILMQAYLDNPPPGWTSLVVIILFIAALQFLFLGIMGEYLGHVFMIQKQRPIFLVAKTTF